MDKAKLIEKIKEKLHYELSGREDAMVYITKEEADLILTSLTAPVDGKEYPALWLIREGDYVYVRMEINKEWITLIREHYDGPFSHIIESLGIKEKLTKMPDAG